MTATDGPTRFLPATFECKVEGGSFTPCSSPFTASSLGLGAHSIQGRGTDALGNVGRVATRDFNVAAPPAAKKKCQKAKKRQASAAKKCKKR